jgi:hypothetical protein
VQNEPNSPDPKRLSSTLHPPALAPTRPSAPSHAGDTTTAIAAALQVDRHTLAHWKRLPAFQQEIRRLIDRPPAAT